MDCSKMSMSELDVLITGMRLVRCRNYDAHSRSMANYILGDAQQAKRYLLAKSIRKDAGASITASVRVSETC